MLFSCVPPSNECEWAHIRGFASLYNDMHNKAYGRTGILSIC